MNKDSISSIKDIEIIKQKYFHNIYSLDKTGFSITLEGYKQAAVLVPIVMVDDNLTICLTERSHQVDHHKGQISFPGGMVEESDLTPEDTAIRETQEEIGIEKSEIDIFGKLDEVYSISGYLIHPFIAQIKSLMNLTINSIEVKEIFFIPLIWILDNNNRRMDNFIDSNGACRRVWFFSEFQGKIIWGITASILVQFADLINK